MVYSELRDITDKTYVRERNVKSYLHVSLHGSEVENLASAAVKPFVCTKKVTLLSRNLPFEYADKLIPRKINQKNSAGERAGRVVGPDDTWITRRDRRRALRIRKA
ncbi:hypothetical protein EVAR_85441_1 [Eumeta japonica]|uniref:Uncharacterized protein n=1 Tax=Eumeta variegata TaxID=151549 RepID=A0A4C1WLP7_EUMVA|nr:hypothetical protein EVAR_85441_1 [Eumeta japonica]